MSDAKEGPIRRFKPERSLKGARLPSKLQADLVALCETYRRELPSERRGIMALFDGPARTGKTEAAEVLAGELGLDLYRIDLSSLVSKYIGETEKNLDRIFKQAEEAEAILFFDEADALFGKRSEVKDSHERYANMDVGYLLQRIKEYRGITIFATNLHQEVDDAFVGPLRTVNFFTEPGVGKRRRS